MSDHLDAVERAILRGHHEPSRQGDGVPGPGTRKDNQRAEKPEARRRRRTRNST